MSPQIQKSQEQKNIYTIPAGISFSKVLAHSLVSKTRGCPEELAKYRIFLPTRRACRLMKDTFINAYSNAPILLPQMQPLGDMDEQELTLSALFESSEPVKPSISALQRQILLAKIIMKLESYSHSIDQSMALAQALGKFLDQIIIEELDIKNLAQIVPEDFADHWQITLDFLKIISQEWPKILVEQGLIDAAQRRKELTYALTQHWKKHPIQTPVIAAGSTGSIPSTAALLNVISSLPQGCVILPGLDLDMDEKSWDIMDESHPQFGMKELLNTMEVSRGQVKVWGDLEQSYKDNKTLKARQFLAREIMRPAQTSSQWQRLSTSKQAQEDIAQGLKGVSLLECKNQKEEAQIIATYLREVLEEEGRTATLITPDRSLGRSVSMAAQRWGIQVDESAGRSLAESDIGVWLRICADAAIKNLAPVSLLSLLKHKYCFCSHDFETYRKTLEVLEINLLRGLKSSQGIKGLHKRNSCPDDKKLQNLLVHIEEKMNPFLELVHAHKSHKFSDILKVHLETAEAMNLLTDDLLNKNLETYELNMPEMPICIWQGEAGEQASSLFAELQEYSHLLPKLSVKDYFEIITMLMQNISVRPHSGMHSRLTILGQWEGRLIDTDLIILGGLNEGTWPADAAHDPWMSRPMRKAFGLTQSEREIGLAAHDFVQAFCFSDVVLTRSKKLQSAPSVPSRWLQRLDTILQASGSTMNSTHHRFQWLETLDAFENLEPTMRPEPRPPIDKRPKELPVSRISTWLKDPYQIYARYILKLKKLQPLEKDSDAADKGTLLHAILERFIKAYPDHIPKDAKSILLEFGKEEIAKHHDDPLIWNFWWPRFSSIADWFLTHEREWRERAKPIACEIKGSITLEPYEFTLTALADRIDQVDNNASAIIDYKSAGQYSKSAILQSKEPQLPLEAAILLYGGFNNETLSLSFHKELHSLSYWKLTGAKTAGEIISLNQIDFKKEKTAENTHSQNPESIEEVVENALSGLKELIEKFQDSNTPYYSIPHAEDIPRFSDYEHLARVKEWSVLDDSNEEAA